MRHLVQEQEVFYLLRTSRFGITSIVQDGKKLKPMLFKSAADAKAFSKGLIDTYAKTPDKFEAVAAGVYHIDRER